MRPFSFDGGEIENEARLLGGPSLDAGFAMGSIAGCWRGTGPEVREIFALGLVRRCVISALQAEGYSFTIEQFSYWLAGAAVLDTDRPPLARPARLVCDLVVNALALSRCEDVALAAEMFRRMAMPAPDQGDHGDMSQCYEALDAAREIALRSRFAGGSGPAGVVDRLAAAAKLARGSVLLATRVAEERPFSDGRRWVVVRDEPERAPSWVLDLEIGGFLSEALPGMPALPCPGLFDRSWLRIDDAAELDLVSDARGRDDLSMAYRRLAVTLSEMTSLMDQAILVGNERIAVARRVTAKSRLPQLLAILSIMERLRSSQIEAALSVTRIGVRGIVESGVELGIVRHRKGRGLNMIELDTSRREPPPLPARRDVTQSIETGSLAIAEVDDALAFADKVLDRFGGSRLGKREESRLEDDWDDDTPAWD